MTEDPLGPGGYICNRCGAEFTEEQAFMDHVSSHVTNAFDAEFVCTLCGESFYSRADLEAHGVHHVHESAAA